MESENKLDMLATREAKRFMGEFAWPSITLAVVTFALYLATPVLVKFGVLSIGVGFLIMTICTYAAYTVFHDAVHGSIAGRNSDLRWVNEVTGYFMGWILTMPLTAHRVEHLAHHRHTNHPSDDPDIASAQMGRSPWHALLAGFKLANAQQCYYIKQCWGSSTKARNRRYAIELAAIVVLRIAVIVWLGWTIGLWLLVAANILGGLLTQYLFAYLVHRPHQEIDRYGNTLSYVVPGRLGTVVNWAWGYQNYHSIHHLFPRVPFYRYAELFSQIEPIMLSRGSPIFYLSKSGWRKADASIS